MKNKTFVMGTVVGVFIILFINSVIVCWIDPYQQYHKPLKELSYPMEMNSFAYYNPGIAKNYEYDTVITGSSMSRAFLTSYVDQVLQCQTVKLSMAEARGKDFADLFEVLEQQENWKRVIMGIDTFAFKVDKDYSSYDKPLYLYDNNVWNDLYYVANKDGLIESCKVLLNTIRGGAHTSMDAYQNYVLDNTFSREQVLQYYTGKVEWITEYDAEQLRDTVLDNINQNLIPYIERNPDREFIFYFPPYSIVRWANTTDVEEDFACMRIIIEKLIRYSNVSIYFYQGEEEVITDLDHYMDTIHFDSVIANRIVDYMADAENKLTTENYEQVLNDWMTFIREYDYAALQMK